MAKKAKRPSVKIGQSVRLAPHKRAIPAYGDKPFVPRVPALPVLVPVLDVVTCAMPPAVMCTR